MKNGLFPIIGLILFPMILISNPSAPIVQKGVATFHIQENCLEICASDRSIIHWEDFSINSHETTRFIQPDSASIAVNTVTSFNPSIINGVLEANGRVILINPNGVVIGKDGVIRTAEFIASTVNTFDNNWNFQKGSSLDLSMTKGGINHQGIIEATEMSRHENQVLLVAKEVTVDGTISGQTVEILGDKIDLQKNTHINVCTPQKGGTILIGGDQKGQNKEIYNSQSVIVEKGALLQANGLGNGDGGRVIVWSNKHTHFLGDIEAKGGNLGGDGGFIEISSPGYLHMEGQVNSLAPKGKTGTFLLDPTDVIISNDVNSKEVVAGTTYSVSSAIPGITINALSLIDQLDKNNVVIDTAAPIDGQMGDGNISVVTPITSQSGHSLTLKAAGHVEITDCIYLVFGGDITIECGGKYTQNPKTTEYRDCTLCTKKGNISVTAQNDIIICGNKGPLVPDVMQEVFYANEGTIKLLSQNGSIILDGNTNPSCISIQTDLGLEITAFKDISILSSPLSTDTTLIQPKNHITVTALTGSINCAGEAPTTILSDGNITIKSIAGSINLGDENATKIKIQSTNQDITIQAKKDLCLSNGKIKDAIIKIVGGVTSHVTLQANKGSITLNSCLGPGEITTSGNKIQLLAPEGNISCNTDLGGQIFINPSSTMNISTNNLTLNSKTNSSNIQIQHTGTEPCTFNINKDFTMNGNGKSSISSPKQITITTGGDLTIDSGCLISSQRDIVMHTLAGSINYKGTTDINIVSDGNITLKATTGSINLGDQNAKGVHIKSSQHHVTLQADKDIHLFNGSSQQSIIEIIGGLNSNVTLQTSKGNIILSSSHSPGEIVASGGQIQLLALQGDTSFTTDLGGQIFINPSGNMNISTNNLTLDPKTITSNIQIQPTGTKPCTFNINKDFTIKGAGKSLISSQNPLNITTGGDLIIDSGCAISSQKEIAINSSSINCKGTTNTTILCDGNITLKATTGSINLGDSNSKTIHIKSNGQKITLQAEKDIHLSNGKTQDSIIEIIGKINSNITLQANKGDITLASLYNGKVIASGGQIELLALQKDASFTTDLGGQISVSSQNSLNITTGGDLKIENNCAFLSQGDLTLNVGKNLHTQGNAATLGIQSQTGKLAIIAGETITIGPKASIAIPGNNIAVLKANKSIMMQANSLIQCFFEEKDCGINQQLVFIIDNQCPLPPKSGDGQFILDATATILKLPKKPILIYTVRPSQNSIEGEIAGGFFIPNKSEINTLTEQWGVYFPQKVQINNSPFIVFYKDKVVVFQDPPTSQYTNEILTILGNLFDTINSSRCIKKCH